MSAGITLAGVSLHRDKSGNNTHACNSASASSKFTDLCHPRLGDLITSDIPLELHTLTSSLQKDLAYTRIHSQEVLVRQALNIDRFDAINNVSDTVTVKTSPWSDCSDLRDEDIGCVTMATKKVKKRKKKSKSGKRNNTKASNKVGDISSTNDTMMLGLGALGMGLVATSVPIVPKSTQTAPPTRQSPYSLATNNATNVISPTQLTIKSKTTVDKMLTPHQSMSLPKMSTYPSVTPRLMRSRNKSVIADNIKMMKVYLSDRQSCSIKVCGLDLPCAPPATPTPVQLMQHEYIPSMADIRSQRALKVRLQTMQTLVLKKKSKELEEQLRMDQQSQKEKQLHLKAKQRLQIYALNKVMTEAENRNFQEFCRTKGLNTSKPKR